MYKIMIQQAIADKFDDKAIHFHAYGRAKTVYKTDSLKEAKKMFKKIMKKYKKKGLKKCTVRELMTPSEMAKGIMAVAYCHEKLGALRELKHIFTKGIIPGLLSLDEANRGKAIKIILKKTNPGIITIK